MRQLNALWAMNWQSICGSLWAIVKPSYLAITPIFTLMMPSACVIGVCLLITRQN